MLVDSSFLICISNRNIDTMGYLRSFYHNLIFCGLDKLYQKHTYIKQLYKEMCLRHLHLYLVGM